MATRQTSVKIPKNVRKSRAAFDAAKHVAFDGGRARLTQIAQDAHRIGKGLDALLKINGLNESLQSPEVAALAKDPRTIKAINLIISKLHGQVDSIIREQQAQQNTDDPTRAAAAIGTDAGIPWLAMDADTRQQVEDAAKKAARIRNASIAVNPARVAMGLHDDVDFDPVATMEAKK